MTFPVVAATNTSSGTTSTSAVVNLPANIASGDLLLMAIALGAASVAITTPSGWTQIFDDNVSTVGECIGLYYKKATGSEGSTVTVTIGSSNWAAHTWRITGWDGVTAPVVSTRQQTISATHTPPALTPAWGALDTLWFVVCGHQGATSTTTTYPTNYTSDQLDTNSTTTNAAVLTSAHRNAITATETPGSFTISTSVSGSAFTIAVKPPSVQFVAKTATGASGWFGTGAVGPITLPSSVAGDVFIMAVETAGQDPGAISGWTAFGNVNNGQSAGSTTATSIYLYWARNGVGNPTVPDSGDHQQVSISSWRGCVSSGSPIGNGGVVGANSGASAVSSLAAAAFTTYGPDEMVIWFASGALSGNTLTCATVNTFTGFTDMGTLEAQSVGNGGTLGGAYGTKTSAGTLSSPSATFTIASTAQQMAAVVFSLLPNIEDTNASGAMGHVSGSAVVTNGEYVVVSGALGHVSGSAAIVVNNTATVSGALGHVSGSAAATNGEYVVVSGALGNVSGSAAVTISTSTDATISGALGNVSGSAAVTNGEYVIVSGALGNVSGSGVVTNGEYVAVSGNLGNVSGSSAVALTDVATIAGALGAVNGSAAGTVGDYVIIAGSMGAVTGSAAVTVGEYVGTSGAMGAISGASAVTIGQYVAVAGVLGNLSGSAAIEIDDTVIAAGAMGRVSGSIDIDVQPPSGAVISGDLGAISGSAEVGVGAALQGTGALGRLSGSADVAIGLYAGLTGALGAVDGSSSIVVLVPVDADIAGALGRVSGRVSINDGIAVPLPRNPLAIATAVKADRIIVTSARDRVITGTSIDRVIVGAAVDRVGTALAVDRIITAAAVNRIAGE